MEHHPRYWEKRVWVLTHKESVKRSNIKQYEKNKEKRRLLARTYASENRERNKAYMKEYARDRYLVNREKIIAATKAYAKSHPEIRRKSALNYRKNHPERYKEQVRMSNQKSMAIRRMGYVGDRMVDRLINEWRREETFTCFHCEKKFPIDKMEVDHLYPISKGGKHTVENVCQSCDKCNNRKRAKLYRQLLQRLGLLNSCFMFHVEY